MTKTQFVCPTCGAIQGEPENLKKAVQELYAVAIALGDFLRENFPSASARTQLVVIEHAMKHADEIFREVFGLVKKDEP